MSGPNADAPTGENPDWQRILDEQQKLYADRAKQPPKPPERKNKRDDEPEPSV